MWTGGKLQLLSSNSTDIA